METIKFGRTGLEVSVAGLGCGGHSRLGMARGETEAHAAGIVRHALALGINFIDTANAYGTEGAVGKGIAGRRDEVVISTKTAIAGREAELPLAKILANLEASLRALGTDTIDIYNLHGLTLKHYDYAMNEVVPALQREVDKGKIRFLGVTELFNVDTRHALLEKTLADDVFDVIMVGFNLLNPCARDRVFPVSQARGVATQIMFAVRRALVDADSVRAVVNELKDRDELDLAALDGDDALAFVTAAAGVSSLTEAAYRYCRHEAGADVVLTGTGSAAHLDENVAAILAPPLPDAVKERLDRIFAAVDSVTGN